MEIISEFRGEHRFLSNFWLVRIIYAGWTFRSVEHAYQCAKIAAWDDCPAFHAIQQARTPGEAKRLARTIPFEIDPNWDECRVRVMDYLLAAKFAPDTPLADRLLATGDAELREGNHWGDRFWGVDAHSGEGRNVLGQLLMKQRAWLKAPARPWEVCSLMETPPQ